MKVFEWSLQEEIVHRRWIMNEGKISKNDLRKLYSKEAIAETRRLELEAMLKLKPWGRQWRTNFYLCGWGCHLVPKGQEDHASNGRFLCPVHHRPLRARIENSKKNGMNKPRVDL